MKGKHMDKKEWLSRYPAMLAEAKELSNELEDLVNQTSPHIKKHVTEIENRLAKCLDGLEQVQAAIAALPDPMERLVLRKRYTGGEYAKLKPWKEIAQELRGRQDETGLKAVQRLHNKGVNNIQLPVEYRS